MASSIACDAVEERISRSTSTPAPTAEASPVPTDTSVPATAVSTEAPASTNAPTGAAGLVLPVSIAPVLPNIPDYDRGDWRHWTDEDGDCQNARQEVLIAESNIPVSFESGERCRVATGSWVGPYTGETVTDPGDLDVDHVVPLANAHRSGAWSWDRDRKREYANSLDYDDHLLATTSGANRAKGAKGPEEWRPSLEEYWCDYAIDWATIKAQWGLTVTEAEYAALAEMLATCATTVLLQPTQGSAPQPPTPTVPRSLPTDLRYDPFGPDRDCGDFDDYGEALAFYLAAGGPESDRHKLDSNGDGEPCETLPGGPSAATNPETPQVLLSLYSERASPGISEIEDCVLYPSQSAASIYLPSSLIGPHATSECPHPQSLPSGTATQTADSPPDQQSTPVPTPELTSPHAPGNTAPPEPPIPDRDCGDFTNWEESQLFFHAEGGPTEDRHGLDRNGDGIACQSLPGAPEPSGVDVPAADSPVDLPAQLHQPEKLNYPAFVDLPFDPSGTDRDCHEFTSWWDAQNFYLASGGPENDPHRLDHDGDGIACQSLYGAPHDDPEPPIIEHMPDTRAADFIDRDCSDFAAWQDAQDFFLTEGGPGEDLHGLDRDGDGIACQSLPGAPDDDPEPPKTKADPAPETPAFVDRNCSDFATQPEAQEFFLAEGGPGEDRHRLDRDGNGMACQSLPGAPDDDPEPPETKADPAAETPAFVDRNCSDFHTWREAQDFYEAEGGPSEDPHRLDRDRDGTACEGLPGAPAADDG